MTLVLQSVSRDEDIFRQARIATNPTRSPDPEPLCPTSPGEHSWVVLQDGLPRARATIQPMRGYAGTGNIALFECADDPEVAAMLFHACQEHLRAAGCTRMIGPLDGDTWHGYRTSDPSEAPPFLLDRTTPPWHGKLFQECGFQTCDQYLSTWVPRDSLSWSRLDRGIERLHASGGSFRSFLPEDWEAELDHLHALSNASFSRNAWACPIGRENFQALYAPFRPLIQPNWIQWAIDSAGAPLGYVFAVPDRAADGTACRVIKTVATSTDPRARGLGSLLVESMHRQAHFEGCSGVVHALMHQQNPSTAILSKGATTLRTYRLWSKDIS